MSNVPNIPAPPPRNDKAARRKKRSSGGHWIAWVLSLGLGVAAGALSYEWLPPVTDVFNDIIAAIS